MDELIKSIVAWHCAVMRRHGHHYGKRYYDDFLWKMSDEDSVTYNQWCKIGRSYSAYGEYEPF